ncbi:MAG: sugar ABC transporter substrate-binding protein [Ectothiorhodospiraceae bacterium]|nr:sugar ABC transporter substrate-binding protein [Ectothiorhodospiraceae bacterium]
MRTTTGRREPTAPVHRLSLLGGALLGMMAAGIASAADKVVTIWHTEPNPKSVAVMKEVIAEYEKMNPGIKINQEPIPWGDLDTKLQAALAAGAPPDASHGQAYVERSLSAKGLLVPIDDVIKSIGEDDIYDVVKKLNYHDGHYYGLAHAIGTDLIVYRKDLYREAGVSMDPPKTWDEWLAGLKKLTKEGQAGLSLAGPGFFMNEEVYMWLGSNGGRLFDEKGRPAFTEKQMIETLNFWKELDECCLPKGWLSHSYADTFANLATGKAASILGWGRGAYEFEKYAPDVVKAGDFGVFNSKPVGPSANGVDFVTQLDCEPWMVFKQGKHPQEAIDFLKFFYQKDNYTKYIHSVPTHFFPIRKSVRQSEVYKAHPDLKNWSFWVDAQENVIANHDPKPLMMSKWDHLTLPYVQEIATSGILIDMVTDVLRRGKSPEEATARAQQRAEQLITDLGYKNW